jgi:transmembrane sensor
MTDNPIWEQAMDWHERLRACPDDQRLSSEIAQWRAEDPLHERAWKRVCRVWGVTGAEAAEPVQPPLPAANDRGWAQGRRGWTVAGGALAASIALMLAAPQILLMARADYRTGTAVMRNVALADGSMTALGPDSAIAIRYGEARREVDLLQGQAFFDVVHEPSKPFTVHAGNSSITVLGTAFDVRRGDHALTVSVARGAVRVMRDGEMLAESLRMGEELRVPLDMAETERLHIDPGRAGQWRQGKLIADNMRLADFVEALDPYYDGKIILSDSSLGDRRVTGIYELNDPRGALAMAVRPFGARVRAFPWLMIAG